MRRLLVFRWSGASSTTAGILLWIGWFLNAVHSVNIPVSLDWTSKGAITPVNRYTNAQASSAVVIVGRTNSDLSSG